MSGVWCLVSRRHWHSWDRLIVAQRYWVVVTIAWSLLFFWYLWLGWSQLPKGSRYFISEVSRLHLFCVPTFLYPSKIGFTESSRTRWVHEIASIVCTFRLNRTIAHERGDMLALIRTCREYSQRLTFSPIFALLTSVAGSARIAYWRSPSCSCGRGSVCQHQYCNVHIYNVFAITKKNSLDIWSERKKPCSTVNVKIYRFFKFVNKVL